MIHHGGVLQQLKGKEYVPGLGSLTFSSDYRFETPKEPPPSTVEDDVYRREEEELERVLEMSIHHRGGRNGHVSAQSSSLAGAGAAGSSTVSGPTYPSCYVPERSPPATSPMSTLPT